jgi:hypothetical protein
MGILPRGERPTDGGRRKVAAVNALIKSLDDGKGVTFIDVSEGRAAAAKSFRQPSAQLCSTNLEIRLAVC